MSARVVVLLSRANTHTDTEERGAVSAHSRNTEAGRFLTPDERLRKGEARRPRR
jgi:hypothetical protein